MEFLTNFVDWFSGMIESVFGFFTSAVDNLKMLTEYISLAATTCYNLIASLPTWLQVFGSVTVLISILYMILGRESGGAKSD